MSKSILIKLLIATVLLAVLALFVIAPVKQTAKVCAQYHDRPCNWYFPGSSECLCEGERLFLTQGMVEKRREGLEASYSEVYNEYEYPNFTEILEVSNFSK